MKDVVDSSANYKLLLLISLIWSFSVFCVEPEQQLVWDVKRSMHDDQYETLLVGEREVLLVVNEASTPISKGVAVLIGEAGQGPFSHQRLAPLASLLNDVGWVSMIMTAPSSAFLDAGSNQEQGAATDSPEQASPNPLEGQSIIDSEAFTLHEQELMTQLQAVTQRTQQYPGFFLVIAQGTTAAWITKLYSEKQIDLPDALVIISPFWPQREFNMQLPRWVAETEMPVLDIYSPWDSEWSLKRVKERNVAATKALKLHYRQRELIGQTIDQQQYAFLSKEIYGWLSYMGW